jgi:hypothetical protein
MTIDIAENVPRISYSVAQGVTQTSFAVPFEFFDDSDLNVYVDGTLKTITTNYTVSGGSGTTGTVTMSVTGGTGGSTVILTRDIPLDRTTDFPTSGAFQVAALNTELDRLVAIQADLQDDVNRSLRLTDYDVSVSLVLPDVTTRKGKTLAFNESTGAVESGPSISDTQSVADASADIELLADIQDGTVATNAITNVNTIRTDVTAVAGVAANVTTVAGISANVTTVAGISANVTTVAGISADVTSVAGVSSQISLLGTVDAIADMNVLGTADVVNDMNVLGSAATVTAMNLLGTAGVVADMAILATADIVADMNTLATADVVNDMNVLGTADVVSDMNTLGTAQNVTNMNTLAGISGDITNVSGISANVTTVAGVSANVTTVAGISANVSTVAGIAANVTTVAGVSGNVTTVAGIDTEVTTLAGLDTEIVAIYADLPNLNVKVGKTADTGSAILPAGTTGQRDVTPTAGYIRYNTSTNSFEGYGASWMPVGGGATGGGNDAIFVENDLVVTTNYTIPATKNAHTVGPISINSGISVTVSSGSRWLVS